MLSKLIFAFATMTGIAWGQGACIPGQALTSRQGFSNLAAVVPQASISVSPGPIYTDQTDSTPASNPITADSFGNYQICAVQASTQTVTVSGPNMSPYTYKVTFPSSIQGASTSANNTFTGSNLFQGTTTFTNLVSSQSSGVFTNTQMNPTLTSLVNGLNITTEFNYAQGSNFDTEAITGGITIPPSATVRQSSAVVGYISNLSTTQAGVAGYFQSTCRANTAHCWGTNLVSQDIVGLTGPLTLYGTETDVDPQNSPGTYGTLIGHDMILNAQHGASGVWGSGFVVDSQGASAGGMWQQGFRTSAGAAQTAFSVGPACFSGSCGSQPINFNGSSGTSGILGTQQGDFSITPQSGRTLNVNSTITAAGATAGLTGTGACATFSGQAGGSSAGVARCTGTTGASTIIITPGSTAPNGWYCAVQDETTRANLLQQTSHSTTTCTLTATSVTSNDVFVFTAIAF